MDDFLTGVGAFVIGVLVTVAAFVIVNQRNRLKGVEAAAGPLKLTFEFHELIKKEVVRVASISLANMVRVDREMIELWERSPFRLREDSEKKLELLKSMTDELEGRLQVLDGEDRYRAATQLREIYREYLRAAREHWASSSGYQEVKHRVVAGLERIERL
jgi:hypothetical protein